MSDQAKEMTLDDAANAVGQMENFFKAFRRVSDVVLFLRTAEQRKKELEDASGKLEADLAEKSRQHTQVVTAQDEVLSALKKKIAKAEANLAALEAGEKAAVESAASTSAALAEAAKKQLQEQTEAFAAAEEALLTVRQATEAEQAKLDAIRAKIAELTAAAE